MIINADGSYSYALDNANPAVQLLGVGATLTDSFSYSISDGNGGTATSTLTITITGTNDGPVANADVAAIVEDTAAPVTGNVLSNDTDPEGDSLSVTTTGAQTGSYGTLSIFGDGSYSYSLDNANPAVQALGVGETATETFSYSISDGNGGTSTSTLTITITGTNDAPVADDDSYVVAEDGSVTINAANGVLNGDTDADGDTLTVTGLLSGPGNGTLTLNADGSFTYTPDPGYNGTDSFVYEVSDGNGGTDTATVTINVGGVNDNPVASPDVATIAEDAIAPVTGNVLTNDTDADGDILTVSNPGDQTGGFGTLTLNADGTYSYSLDNGNATVQALGVGETLTETFTYSVADGQGGTASSTLTITITGTNDGPVADDDSYGVAEDGSVTINAANGVLDGDTDIDGDTLTVTGVLSGPGNGTLTLNADGSFTYTPAPGYNGTDSFIYEVSDGNGGTDTATVTINVGGVNDDPVANPDVDTIAEDTVAPVTGNVLTNDTDVDGDILTVSNPGDQTGGYGTLTLNTDGTYSYALDNGNGTVQALSVGETLSETFTYSVSDGQGGTASSTLTITITGTNDGPVANADAATIAEDAAAPVTGNVLTNDTDVDGDALAVTTTGAQAGTYGSVTIAANGAYSYALNSANPAVQALGVGETLTETFSYSISDGNGGTSTSTLTITITGTNDGPVANAGHDHDRGGYGRPGHRQRADQRHRCGWRRPDGHHHRRPGRHLRHGHDRRQTAATASR